MKYQDIKSCAYRKVKYVRFFYSKSTAITCFGPNMLVMLSIEVSEPGVDKTMVFLFLSETLIQLSRTPVLIIPYACKTELSFGNSFFIFL